MKFRAFTLIEMLVTLTLFSMIMVVVTGLLGTSLRFMQSIGGSDRSKSSAILLAKLLDKTLSDAYRVTATNGVYLIDAFDDRQFAAEDGTNRFVLSENRGGTWNVIGDFKMDTAKEVRFDLMDRGGRQAVHFTAVFPDGQIDRLMVLGYSKHDEAAHE